jgi:hypothetical protein
MCLSAIGALQGLSVEVSLALVSSRAA